MRTQEEQNSAAEAIVSDYGLSLMESHPHLGSYLPRDSKTKARPNMIDLVDVDTSAPGPRRNRADSTMMGVSREIPAEYLADESKRTLGTFNGVFMYVAVSVFGVVLFARMGWMVAYGGLGLAILICVISALVTLVTTTSVAALVTNGKVMAGGPYALVARSVGVEFGSVVGVIYALAQVVTIALNDVGFAASVVSLYAPDDSTAFTKSSFWDTIIIAQIANVMMLVVCWAGVEWVNNSNNIFMGSILIGFVAFTIGTFYRPANHIPGYTGWSTATFLSNQAPRFDSTTGFFTLFGVYFPAVTGVLQGANLTGDLKDPGRAIPVGTISAIVFCTSVYIFVLFVCAATANYSLLSDINTDFEGLVAVWRPLVIQGLYAAALSTSVGMLVGAPRVLIATLDDGLFPPVMNWLKVLNASGDPMRGYIVCTIIAMVVTFFGGSFNSISPLVSNLFMVVYGVINLACFLADYYSSPGWRPQYKYFNKWVSLFGAVCCIASMFVIDLVSCLIVLFFSIALYLWIRHKKPMMSGGAMEAASYLQAIQSVLQVETMTDGNKKNFRPSLMVLTNLCDDAEQTMKISSLFYKSYSLLMQGRVLVGKVTKASLRERKAYPTHVKVTPKLIALSQTIINPTLHEGVSSLIQSTGLGKLSPNTIVIEFPEDWRSCLDQKLTDFVDIIKLCLRFDMSIVITRARNFKFDSHDETQSKRIGFVDCHWMYDDGGMTLLLAQLLLKSRAFEDCRMRVFVPNEEEEQQIMLNRAANHLTFNAHTVNAEAMRQEVQRLYTAFKVKNPATPLSETSSGSSLVVKSLGSNSGSLVPNSVTSGSSASTPNKAKRASVMDVFGIKKPDSPSGSPIQAVEVPVIELPKQQPSDHNIRVSSNSISPHHTLTDVKMPIIKSEGTEKIDEIRQLIKLLRIRATAYVLTKDSLDPVGPKGKVTQSVDDLQMVRQPPAAQVVDFKVTHNTDKSKRLSLSGIQEEDDTDVSKALDVSRVFSMPQRMQDETTVEEPQNTNVTASATVGDVVLNMNPLFQNEKKFATQRKSFSTDNLPVRRNGSSPDLASLVQNANNATKLFQQKRASKFGDDSMSSLQKPSMSASNLEELVQKTASSPQPSHDYQSPLLGTVAEYANAITAQSAGSTMVFLTIPVPRSSHTAREYMCCLDELSGRLVADKVPVIFVRGNNQNVLTPWL